MNEPSFCRLYVTLYWKKWTDLLKSPLWIFTLWITTMDLHYLSVSYDYRSAKIFLIALVSHRFATPQSLRRIIYTQATSTSSIFSLYFEIWAPNSIPSENFISLILNTVKRDYFLFKNLIQQPKVIAATLLPLSLLTRAIGYKFKIFVSVNVHLFDLFT